MELNNFFDNLTDEQKEKAKACKTADEFTAFAEKEGIELTDEMLDEVAGGRYSAHNIPKIDTHGKIKRRIGVY